ncbi:FK506-binding protein 15-like isoform X2 [Stigmatopora nigra]
MFGGDDEDRDFLSPAGGAKLASLFGIDENNSQGNESFHYIAPKQPRKNSNPVSVIQTTAPSPGTFEVLIATAVQAFRYINGQYVKQGKLGAAILGNHTSKEYKLLLYLSQQKPVTSAKIHIDFIFTVQPNNYCTFYDDQRQNWSLMFESEKSASDFCKEVCLAKANTCNGLDVVLTQDLSLGEGQAVQHGDSLEVAYKGWLLQNHTIGEMFDSNQKKDKLLRVKIGAGKVIQGWEKGMLGMKKFGCRLIVVPPNLAYGSKGVPECIPANSTLIFSAALKRVKFSKESGSDQTSSRDSGGTLSSAPSLENLTQEPVVQTGETTQRAKSNSINEQTADVTKAKLISRMAKMGQPLLPFLTSQPDSSDSEFEDSNTSRGKDTSAAPSPVQITSAAPVQGHVLPHPCPAFPSNVLPSITNFATQPSLLGNMHPFQPYSYTQTSVPTQLQSVGQVHPARVPFIGTNDVTSLLMIEARQQNTEIRLAVGKVADRVDQLASKVDDLQRQGTAPLSLSGISMESSMVMQNLLRIIQENECLKKEMFEKSSRIEEQNFKINELLNQNHGYLEQRDTLLEKSNDSKFSNVQSQARLLQAEKDKMQLNEALASTTAQLSEVKLEFLAHQQKFLELQTELSARQLDCERHSQHISELESQLEEFKKISERVQAQYGAEQLKCKEMELKLENMTEEVNDLKTIQDNLKQRCQHHVEVEESWKVKYKQALESIREKHLREMAEFKKERNNLLKEQREKDSQSSTVIASLERRVAGLQKKLNEQESSAYTATEVKRVMNAVFHSLRGEFDLNENYTGQTVLRILMNTIKNETLNHLHGKDSLTTLEKEELSDQEEEEEQKEDLEQKEEKVNNTVLVSEENAVSKRMEDGDHHRSQDPIHQDEAEMREQLPDSKEQFASDAPKFAPMTGLECHEKQEQAVNDTSGTANAKAGPHQSVLIEGEEEQSSVFLTKSGDIDPDSQECVGPPVKPPPPPNELQFSKGENKRLTGELPTENGESISQVAPLLQEEEEEDELSLKGRPPPDPLLDNNNNSEDDDPVWRS